MGYSARYHAASLAAVFLALAVGILIGAGFGDELVEGGAEELEASLQSDLEDARAEIEDLQGELDEVNDYVEETYPALVSDTLVGRSLAVVALGGQPEELRDHIGNALEPTGAQVGQVAVVGEPPDRDALADAAGDGRFEDLDRDDEALSDFARRVGRDLVAGGALYERASDSMLSGFSGEPAPVDGVIVVRDRPDDLDEDEAAITERLESGLLEGMAEAGASVVGVQGTESDSSVGFFESRGISTVDNVDMPAGRVSLVFVLRGAQGNYGVGDDADALMPDLLAPPAGNAASGIPAGGFGSGN
jgi:Copper transport outer membrane protein, MctB